MIIITLCERWLRGLCRPRSARPETFWWRAQWRGKSAEPGRLSTCCQRKARGSTIRPTVGNASSPSEDWVHSAKCNQTNHRIRGKAKSQRETIGILDCKRAYWYVRILPPNNLKYMFYNTLRGTLTGRHRKSKLKIKIIKCWLHTDLTWKTAMSSRNGLSEMRTISAAGTRYLMLRVRWSRIIMEVVDTTNKTGTSWMYKSREIKNWIGIILSGRFENRPCQKIVWFCWRYRQRRCIDRPFRWPVCAIGYSGAGGHSRPGTDEPHCARTTLYGFWTVN